ncbi:MAG: hypothetical protein H2038_05975 [Brevundimonas sp.]|uniref:hypothetical protein n=1 Tax=Brevundimonas sp. TaxID=1871086 RepID=UPI001848D3A5|nr:hypothetical protein [Brevundimonas sp.]MBA4804182.1 hypothetical protein [Brevundimonas sp.]
MSRIPRRILKLISLLALVGGPILLVLAVAQAGLGWATDSGGMGLFHVAIVGIVGLTYCLVVGSAAYVLVSIDERLERLERGASAGSTVRGAEEDI